MLAKRVAWAVVVLSTVCTIADTTFSALHASLLSQEVWADHGWPMVTLATFGSAVMGMLIVSRYPRHPIGWLLLVAGLSSVSIATDAASRWALDQPGTSAAAAGHALDWVSALFGSALAMTGVIIIFLIAPDGRLLAPGWRWVARATVVGYVLYVVSVLSISPTRFDPDSAGPGVNAVAAVGITLMILSLLASCVALFVRLRGAQGETRRQLLWIAMSAALLAGTFAWFLVVQRLHDQTGLSVVVLYGAYLSLPVCVAVAVLRHRMFDIDLIVNRALIVMIATVGVGASYVLVVVLLGAVVGGRVGFWPALLATAVVAVAVQPARRSVVRLADRLAYGAAAEPYDALADFTRRLGESPDPSDLLPAVADAAAGAVGAAQATATLRLPFGGTRSATSTRPGAAASATSAEVVIADADDILGTLAVSMPPGRSLRGIEHKLLCDLADQAVVAFRNASLAAELAHEVDQLDHQTQALEESRRRLITAGDAERRRLERAISRDVAPHLESIPARIDALAEASGELRAELVQPLRVSAEAALEALREITRGVFPTQLTRAGLEPAVRSLVARTPGARLEVEMPDDPVRADPRVEAAAYFCIAESMRDVAGPVAVTLRLLEDEVVAVVAGTMTAALPIDTMRDRVEALGGSVAGRGAEGRTVLEVRLPQPPAPVTASQRTEASVSG